MEKVQLCAEELFFMGKQMRAKYIDYEYVSMMEDLQQQYALREKEIMAGIVQKGLMMEDFSGDMELDQDVETILKPVFFGEFESELLVADLTDEDRSRHMKYHFYDGQVTQAAIIDGKLEFSKSGDIGIDEQRAVLLSGEYDCSEAEYPIETINKEKITLVVQLKNTQVGKTTAASELVCSDGIWYIGATENTVRTLSKEAFTSCFNRIMKGE